MNKAKNWFSGLTAGGKVGAIVGGFVALFMTVGIVGAAVSPSSQNSVQPDTSQAVEEPAEPKVETKTEEETSAVEFKTVVRDDNSLDKGTTQVEQAGVNGERTVVYELTYTDGELTNRKEISDKVTTAPTDRIVRRGTYVAPKPAASNCDSNYAGGCVPVVSYDLDCPDIGFSVTVVGSDPHRFDGNGDGYGCESY